MPFFPPTVCVFCGSSPGEHPAYAASARAFGRELVARGYELVFGGGRTGMMGAVAETVLEAGGAVTGVIPAAMVDADLHHDGLTRLEIVRTMHERKALMVGLAGAFVALPGGVGTFEELLEAITWGHLGLHPRPVGALDTGGFFEGLVTLLDRSVADGFLRAELRDRFHVHPEPAALLDILEADAPGTRTVSQLRW